MWAVSVSSMPSLWKVKSTRFCNYGLKIDSRILCYMCWVRWSPIICSKRFFSLVTPLYTKANLWFVQCRKKHLCIAIWSWELNKLNIILGLKKFFIRGDVSCHLLPAVYSHGEVQVALSRIWEETTIRDKSGNISYIFKLWECNLFPFQPAQCYSREKVQITDQWTLLFWGRRLQLFRF